MIKKHLETKLIQCHTYLPYLTKISSFFLIFLVPFLLLFSPWELSMESWGYWFFARLFAENFEFIIPDRSPLYTLYLNCFRWLGYPLCVQVEQYFTFLVTLFGLSYLLRRYLNFLLAVICVSLWLPILLISEPHVQALSLAFTCFALAVRTGMQKTYSRVLFYSLLWVAALFRMTYWIAPICYASMDLYKAYRNGWRLSEITKIKLKPRYILPTTLLFLTLWFQLMQSPHPFNSAWFASTDWFPNKGKSLVVASMTHYLNMRYMQKTYGTFKDHDFYITNPIIFGDPLQKTEWLKNAVSAVYEHILDNFINLPGTVTSITPLFNSIAMTPMARVWLSLLYLTLIIALAIYLVRDDPDMIIFIGISVFLVVMTVLSFPTSRYNVPLTGVFLLGLAQSICFAKKIATKIVTKTFFSTTLMTIAISLLIWTCSPWLGIWQSAKTNIETWIRTNKMILLTTHDPNSTSFGGFSMTLAYPHLVEISKYCKGILTIEQMFVGAFIPVPLSEIVDIWEVPPIGDFDNSPYNGLRTDRVTCIFDSALMQTLVTEINPQIRRDRYVLPYIQKLSKLGAKEFGVPNYGRVIILPSSYLRN